MSDLIGEGRDEWIDSCLRQVIGVAVGHERLVDLNEHEYPAASKRRWIPTLDTMETSSPVEATFSLTYRERLRAGWVMTLGSPASLLWLSFFPLCGSVLLALTALPSSRNSIWDFVLAALCFGFVPFMMFFNSYRAHQVARKKGPCTYRFDQSGLQVVSKNSELKQGWAAIPRARESRGIVFLYFSKHCAHSIPTRVFADPDAANAVLRLAAAGGVPRVGR